MAGRARRLAAGASLLATAGGFAWLGVRHGSWFDWHTLAFAGGLAVAAFGLTRKWLVGQIVSRAMAWVVLAPTAAVATVEALRGHVDAGISAFAATSAAALLLARPMLHTKEARATFSPSKFRRAFLAASTAATTIAIVLGIVAYEGLRAGEIAAGLGLGMLATSILASAVGVLRMRGWGIALAALTSIVSLVAGLVVGHEGGIALASTALPGVLFLLPIALAKLGVGDPEPASAARYTRVSADAEALPGRVRVATPDDELDREDAAEPRAFMVERRPTG